MALSSLAVITHDPAATLLAFALAFCMAWILIGVYGDERRRLRP